MGGLSVRTHLNWSPTLLRVPHHMVAVINFKKNMKHRYISKPKTITVTEVCLCPHIIVPFTGHPLESQCKEWLNFESWNKAMFIQCPTNFRPVRKFVHLDVSGQIF